MPDDFTHTLLALLNERPVVGENEHDWRRAEEALRGVVVPVSLEPRITESPEAENRFALTICSGMAKVRSIQ
jgi:hypothetical protein